MKQLKIAIFAQLSSPTITQQLAPLLRERGHTVDIVDLSIIPHEGFIEHPEIQNLACYDIAYYRSGLEPDNNAERITQLEAFLKKHSVQTVNLHYTQHPRANSKTYETQLAKINGLTVPKSIYDTPADFVALTSQLGLPFIMKTEYGTHGSGVHMIKNAEEFTQVTKSYPNTRFLHQQFISHDFEYRVHVVNGEVMCIWRKAPDTNDFRSNEAQGGKMLVTNPLHTTEITKLAKKVFTIFGFDIFVVDFMLEKNTDTFYFTEINLNPGWVNTINEVTPFNRSAIAADYFEEICS